jgi:hypothetical protein
MKMLLNGRTLHLDDTNKNMMFKLIIKTINLIRNKNGKYTLSPVGFQN